MCLGFLLCTYSNLSRKFILLLFSHGILAITLLPIPIFKLIRKQQVEQNYIKKAPLQGKSHIKILFLSILEHFSHTKGCNYRSKTMLINQFIVGSSTKRWVDCFIVLTVSSFSIVVRTVTGSTIDKKLRPTMAGNQLECFQTTQCYLGEQAT